LKVKENWNLFPDDRVDDFLADRYEGPSHPSRVRIMQLIKGYDSLLDVGCGPGIAFSMVMSAYPSIDYVGVDVTDKFISFCQRRWPSSRQRFMKLSVYDLKRIDRTFDVVMCRHLLEHLPNHEIAIQSMYDLADKALLLGFYLSPTVLRFGRKKVDKRFEAGFYTYLYDSGKLLQFLTDELRPHPCEVTVIPHLGYSTPGTKWERYENSIYQVMKQKTT
jgi:SAM-dependent methyltransferase